MRRHNDPMNLFPVQEPHSPTPRMLVSKEKGRFAPVDGLKVGRGRFLTERDVWFRPHLQEQLRLWAPDLVVDPFVGEGHLLELAQNLLKCDVAGYDIRPGGDWIANDSLVNIPAMPDSVFLTNPPYLANYSAKRKGVWDTASRYFEQSVWDDLYLVALDRCLEACPRVMAIIPETFLNSSYPKSRLCSFTVLLENPFEDTETPVGVACFDGVEKQLNQVALYVGDQRLIDLGEIEAKRLRARHTHPIIFNEPGGQLALRAVDLQDPVKPMGFFLRGELDYDPAKIKVSSRLVTYIKIPDLPPAEVKRLVDVANQLLSEFRLSCHDLLLSPFKGNDKLGRRRRRLDYATARAIIEQAMDFLRPHRDQPSLFDEAEA